MSQSPHAAQLSRRVAERYLLRGERPVVSTRQHWASVAEPILSAVIVSFLAIAAALSADWGQAAWIVVIPALALVLRAVWKIAEWYCIWFVTTDRRLLKTYGLITQRVAMMPLAKVTDMSYDRSIMGRLLGYGEFVMESAGQDQALRVVRWVPNPDEIYRALGDTIFHDDVHDPGEDGAHWGGRGEAPYAAWEDHDPDSSSPDSTHRWEPVERYELPPDWEWVDEPHQHPVAIDPDPTPWQ